MKKFGDLIGKEIQECHWQTLQITQDGLKIYYLFFVNEVLLFAKTIFLKHNSVNFFDIFYSFSGLKVSYTFIEFHLCIIILILMIIEIVYVSYFLQ